MRSDIRRRVKQLIEEYKTIEPEELALGMGIGVLSCELPQATKGFCLMLSQGTAIVVNQNLSLIERRACVAHELGHAVLHKGFNYMFMSQNTQMVTGKFEREANLFAAYLILESENVCEGETIENFSRKNHLSYKALEQIMGEKALEM